MPKGKKPISYKWVFKVKQNADGSIERNKAMLVVEGSIIMRPSLLVVKITTKRALVTTVMKKGSIKTQLDINAFLHGDLHEDIYIYAR